MRRLLPVCMSVHKVSVDVKVDLDQLSCFF